MNPSFMRTPARRSPLALGALAALLTLPAAALAQEAPAGAGEWRIETNVGVWHQGDRASGRRATSGRSSGSR